MQASDAHVRSRISTPCVHTGAIQTGLLVLLACCVVAGMSPLNAAWSQTDSNDLGSQRTSQAPSRLDQTQNQMYSTPASLQPGAELTQRLWESRMSVPDPNEDADAKETLKNLIEKVRSLTFESNEATPAFSSPTEPDHRTDSNPSTRITQARPSTTAQPAPRAIPPVESGRDLPPATLERLGELLHDPNRVRDPLEMAELLFLSGHPVEAVAFYEKALTLTTRADVTTSGDRAWILFQLGNCLREIDMTKARDAYLKLIAEYPDSPWTELAKAHGRLISWYLSARPQQLLPPRGSQ